MRASHGNNPQSQFNAAPPATVGLGASDHLVRALSAVLARRRPQSADEARRGLRQGYPDAPLAMRIAAISQP